MLSVTLHLLCLVALGAAQTSPVSMWVPPRDLKTPFPINSHNIVASVAGSNGSATTYVLSCASKTKRAISADADTAPLDGPDAKSTDPDLNCGGFPVPYTIVQSPSKIMWTYCATGPGHSEKTPSVNTVSGNCVLSGTTEAVCTATDGTQHPTATFNEGKMKRVSFVTTGAVTTTLPSTSAFTTEYTKKEANLTVSHSGTDLVTDSATRNPSAKTQVTNGASGSPVFRTSSITGISSVRNSASASAPPKSTNIGVQGSNSRRDGVFGALVIAFAGAIL